MLGLSEMALADHPEFPGGRIKIVTIEVSADIKIPGAVQDQEVVILMRMHIPGSIDATHRPRRNGAEFVDGPIEIVDSYRHKLAQQQRAFPCPAHNPASRNGVDNNACFVLKAIEKTGQVVERYRNIIRHPAGIVSRTVIDV